jgi:hypothetical protein
VIPITEFRTFPVSSAEPLDRTVQGTVLGSGDSLKLGAVDTTDEAQDTPVKVVWWRVNDMRGNIEISNIRVWIEGAGDITGASSWYMDITDAWTAGKTAVQVKTGTPGDVPLSEPLPNLARSGGGIITGTGDAEVSQYIYITGNIGVNVPTGETTDLKLRVKFDYH